jgi:transposase
MPKRLIPALSKEEQADLEDLQRHSPKPYLRERASAILKLANKQTASDIACHGLLQKRHRETVTTWFHRFETQGVKGLAITSGRGRKPAFSPSAQI